MKSDTEQLIQERIRDLRENTDFVSTIFENLTGYAIIAADFDGGVIAYNAGAHLIYGYAPSEVVGKQNIAIFFPKGFVEAGQLQSMIEKLVGKGTVSFEAEMVRESGKTFPARVLFTLTKDKSSKIVGFIGIVEDITMRKRAERIDTENQAKAARIAELEQELHSLERLSNSEQVSVTANMYGVASLSQAYPDIFGRLARQYEEILGMALERRAYRVEHNISEGLRSLARELGAMRAGPRDVIDIYRTAVRNRKEDATPQKLQVIFEEGRLMLLELMGYLVSYYRNYSIETLTASVRSKK